MFSAIVYKSTTGSCKKYADLLSARLHIPAFPLGKEYIPADTKIIYVGWLFAGKIMGYDKAAKKYDIGAVVQVGMSPVSAKSEEVCREKNAVCADVPVFTRQGAFNINKLPPHFRFIMKIKNKEIAARFEARKTSAMRRRLLTKWRPPASASRPAGALTISSNGAPSTDTVFHLLGGCEPDLLLR